MDEQELTHWLNALAEMGLIREGQWDFNGQGESKSAEYWIDGRHYSREGAIKLVRDFEAIWSITIVD